MAAMPGHDPSAASAGSARVSDVEPPSQTVSITETAGNAERGLLDLLAIGAVKQSLGSLEFTVRDRTGAVLSRGYNEVHGIDSDRRLLLDLPVGQDYQLELDSNAAEPPATTCHATVGPFAVAPTVTASYQAFLWQCEGASAAPADECYWLADWIGASRTRAAVGESIELSVAGKDASGVGNHVTWSTPAPQFGSILERHAARTKLTCEGANESIPIVVVISGDGCSRRLSLVVSCSAE